MNKKIVILAGKGNSTLYMYNGIKEEFQINKVIIELPVNKKKFIQKRIKKLGAITVFGQILFQILCLKILNLISKNRVSEIKKKLNLSENSITDEILIEIPSVNSNECRELLQKINPDVVIVNGTRIISKKTLSCINAIFINTHTGITPNYRGVHGAYWALANNDIDNCGVTVHLVDTGIDTGAVLYQKNIKITKQDNFTTYPYLQIAEGIKLMKNALEDIINNSITIIEKQSDSKLFSHPTFWGYIINRITKGIK